MDQGAKPSDVLRRISSTTSNDTFISVLKRTLYPVLDDLPEPTQLIILQRLTEAERQVEETAKLVEEIDYDAHEKRLRSQLSLLLKNVKSEYGDYDAQYEIMDGLSRYAIEWLPKLWRVGVEEGLEVQFVQRCLVFCTEIMNKAAGCDSEVNFWEISQQLTVIKSKDLAVYEEEHVDIFHTLAWIWRELLVSVSARNGFTKHIMDDIQRLKLQDKVVDLLRRGSEDDDAYSGRFWDGHWTQAMKDSAMMLLNPYLEEQIPNFEGKISASLYRKLVKQAPDLKESLLDITRQRIFGHNTESATSEYDSAARIFEKDSTEDLLRSLDVLPTRNRDGFSQMDRTKKTLFGVLNDSEQPELRKKALGLVYRSLEQTRDRVVNELHRALPDLEEATEWLKDQIMNGNLTMKATIDGSPRDLATWKALGNRIGYIEQFLTMAKGDFEWEIPTYHISFNDAWAEEQNELSQPNLTQPIYDWADLLCQWTNREDADQIWSGILESTSSEDFTNWLWSIDNFADTSIKWCNNQFGAKRFLADGLKAFCDVFICQNVAELGKVVERNKPHRHPYMRIID